MFKNIYLHNFLLAQQKGQKNSRKIPKGNFFYRSETVARSYEICGFLERNHEIKSFASCYL